MVDVGSAKAAQVGHDPGYGGHAGVWEKERTVGGGCSFSFLFHKNYIGTRQDGQEENVLLPAAPYHRQYLDVEIFICCICAGDGNFNLLTDNRKEK